MSMEKILFTSPSTLDRKSLLLTVIVCVIPSLFFGWMFYSSIAANNNSVTVIWGIMAALFSGIFIAGFVNTPYKYILVNSRLIIKRHIKDTVIPLQDIRQIRLMTKDDKIGLIRTFGMEGAFGSYGYYRTALHKKIIVFVRRYSNWTLVSTGSKNYVIAPDDVQLIDIAAQQIGQVGTDNRAMNLAAYHWRRWLPAAIFVVVSLFVSLLIYQVNMEPKVSFDFNSFKMDGLYGVNIPFSEIAQADTITWLQMPQISLRTNGISLMKVNRGHFKTTDGSKIRLSIYCGVSPVIRIADCRGAVYYINRKNADETRKIFSQLKSKLS